MAGRTQRTHYMHILHEICGCAEYIIGMTLDGCKGIACKLQGTFACKSGGEAMSLQLAMFAFVLPSRFGSKGCAGCYCLQVTLLFAFWAVCLADFSAFLNRAVVLPPFVVLLTLAVLPRNALSLSKAEAKLMMPAAAAIFCSKRCCLPCAVSLPTAAENAVKLNTPSCTRRTGG